MVSAELWELFAEEEDRHGDDFGAPASGDRGGGAFLPDVFPDARQWIEAAFGADLTADPDTWSWTNITAPHTVQWDPGVNITIGEPDESNDLVPARFSCRIWNPDGDFTFGNPYGRYWPNVKENTPIRARLDIGSGAFLRFQGESVSWRPSWDAGRSVSFVTLTATGIGRRIKQGTSAPQSPMWRFHMLSSRYPTSTNAGWPGADQQYHAMPSHFWPLEEGRGAILGANAINPAYPLRAEDSDHMPQFGADSGLLCTRAMPKFINGPNNGTALSVDFPIVRPTGAIVDYGLPTPFDGVRVQHLIRLDESAISALSDSLGTTADGLRGRTLTIEVSSSTLAQVNVYIDHDATEGLVLFAETKDAAGAVIERLGSTTGLQFERGVYVTVDLVQLAGDTEVRFGYVSLTLDPTTGIPYGPPFVAFQSSPATTGATLNGVIGIGVGETENLEGGSVGMVAVYGDTPDNAMPDRYPRALIGRSGDTVAERLYRLGIENNVRIDIIGDADLIMGAQGTAGFLALVNEGVQVDQGILLDGLGAGLTVITRSAAESQAACVTFDDSDIIGPFEAEQDDQGRVNDYTARNPEGMEARFVQPDGPLGTDAVGTYDTGNEHRAAFLDTLHGIAGWRVAQGTVSALRFPRLEIELAKPATAVKANDWLSSRPYCRLDVTGLVPDSTEPDKRFLLRGWTEKWNSRIWTISPTVSPYDAWRVAQLAADTGDAGDYVLWLAEDDDASTLTATVIGTEYRSDGFESGVSLWDGQNGWTLVQDAAHVRTGTQAMKITPPGATASGGAILHTRAPCTGGQTYSVEAWFYAEAGWSDARAAIDWYDSAGAFITSSLGSATVVAAGVWTLSRQVFTAPANAAEGQPRARQGGTPAASDVLWVDDIDYGPVLTVATTGTGPIWTHSALSTHADDVDGLHVLVGGIKIGVTGITGSTSPQTFTVTGSTVTKTIAAGEPVAVHNPPILGL